MRLTSSHLAATTAIFACAAASSTGSRSTLERTRTFDQHESQRLLRDGAEAKGIVNIPGFENAIESTVSQVSKFSQDWTHWLSLRLKTLSAEDAFTYYGLEVDDNLLSTPQFKTWANYVRTTTKTDQESDAAMAKAMAFHSSNVGVARMLEASKTATATRGLAYRLEIALMESWLKKGVQIETVFGWLKLDKGVAKLITSPDINIFTNFVGFMNSKSSNEEALMIDAFLIHYGDIAVGTMLETAKQMPIIENWAKELQVQQFQQWLVSGKDPIEIEKTFEHRKEDDELLKTTKTKISQDYKKFYEMHQSFAPL